MSSWTIVFFDVQWWGINLLCPGIEANDWTITSGNCMAKHPKSSVHEQGKAASTQYKIRCISNNKLGQQRKWTTFWNGTMSSAFEERTVRSTVGGVACCRGEFAEKYWQSSSSHQCSSIYQPVTGDWWNLSRPLLTNIFKLSPGKQSRKWLEGSSTKLLRRRILVVDSSRKTPTRENGCKLTWRSLETKLEVIFEMRQREGVATYLGRHLFITIQP